MNKTGRHIYYSICPHTSAPNNGTGAQYKGKSVYAPPASWSAAQRHALANSILVEYLKNFDLFYSDTVPAGDGGPINAPGGFITNIDSMVQMTEFAYSAPGSWNVGRIFSPHDGRPLCSAPS